MAITKPFNFKNTKGLHLSHLNIRSLYNKLDITRQTISSSDTSIIALSETWLNPKITTKMIEIPGYNCTSLDKSWLENGNVKKGGGVCCYIKNSICYSATDYDNLNKSTRDIEICWVSLNIPLCRKIVVGIVYRPPQGNVNTFCDTLDEHVEFIQENSPTSTELFILGDCNINYFLKNTHDMRELKWFEQKNSLTQRITQVTRFSNTNSCIGLIFTNSNYISNSGTLDVNLSVHELIFLTRKKIKTKNTPTTFNGRSYINFSEPALKNSLKDINWENLYNMSKVNDAWKLIKENILLVIDQMCPTKAIRIKKFKDLWISQEILENIRDKDILLSRAKHSDNLEDWKLARDCRNEVKNIVKNAKSEFIKENLNEHQNDSKRFWKTMSNILPSNKDKSANKIILKDDKGKIIEDNKIAAGIMNNFFTSIGPKLAANYQDPWSYTGKIIENNIPDIRTNRVEVLKLIKDININKSSAIPNLSSKVLKPACLALIDQFTFIFNLCLEKNEFPEEWKYTKVTPLPKDGDMSKCTNYRPISLLPLPGKNLEHIIHDRINIFCNDNKIINENQGGFRKKHSTISTVANFTNDIYSAINKKQISIATFIDFSKAFDTVNHQILFLKLQKIGITGNVLKLLQNYLKNRKQKTIVNNTESEFGTISCGVPQGSVLGPLLFLLYINNLCDSVKTVNTYLYADDTVLVSSAIDIYTAHAHLQNDLTNVANWCKSNKLSINIKKTKSMIMGTHSTVKKHRFLPKLKIEGNAFDYVFQDKYLGITVDESLTFHNHL